MNILRSILLSIRKFDQWFSKNFSWFFTNGNKFNLEIEERQKILNQLTIKKIK